MASNDDPPPPACWSAIENDCPRLFVDDSTLCRVEIRQITPENDGQAFTQAQQKPCSVYTYDEMSSELARARPPDSATITVIYRANSWSRMKITPDMFKLLCTTFQFDSSFMSLVMGMGKTVNLKGQTNSEHFMNIYSQIYGLQPTTPKEGISCNGPPRLSFGVCYNIRYFERHGRDLKNPWSCRQSVIHQKYHFDDNTSNWTVIQPPSHFDDMLASSQIGLDSHPLDLHLRYIFLATVNWREYLDYMGSELVLLDQKLCFPKPFKEFEVDFHVAQHIQWLRGKLHHAETILAGTEAVLRTIQDHSQKLRDLNAIPDAVHQVFLCKMRNISGEIRSHCATVNELVKMSDDIKSTISNILNYRNQEMSTESGQRLAHMTEMTRLENKTLVDMATLSCRDSRTTRIATLIAMFYLPASLVLSFFSTVFVDYGPDGTAHLFVHGQVWVAFVSIVVLGIGTLIGFKVWSHVSEAR